MKVKSPGLKFYVDQLRNGKRFSFVRYGNGEWECIMKLHRGTRSGSQKFTPDLRKALAATLTKRRAGAYYLALQSLSYLRRVKLLPKLEAWLAKFAPERNWYNGEVFTKASYTGKLFPLVSAMKQHRVVVVGPPWLIKLPFASIFVPVAKRNCWADVDAIEKQLRDLKGAVISFSAGPATKVLIHRLQPIIGSSTWLIDFGSVWDPYCGKNSRRYHKRITPAIKRKNLTGK